MVSSNKNPKGWSGFDSPMRTPLALPLNIHMTYVYAYIVLYAHNPLYYFIINFSDIDVHM